MQNQQLTENLTQQDILLSSAIDGKYFCFCISDPHSPIVLKENQCIRSCLSLFKTIMSEIPKDPNNEINKNGAGRNFG